MLKVKSSEIDQESLKKISIITVIMLYLIDEFKRIVENFEQRLHFVVFSNGILRNSSFNFLYSRVKMIKI